jgi:hypothetical protein
MRYTVIGVDNKADNELWIAAVLEGEHRTVDTEPEAPEDTAWLRRQPWYIRDLEQRERWLGYVTADNPVQAERRAQQLYRYGGIPEMVRAADVQPGYLLLDPDDLINGVHETVAERELRVDEVLGDQVLIWVEGDSRPTAYRADRKLAVVTAEGA